VIRDFVSDSCRLSAIDLTLLYFPYSTYLQCRFILKGHSGRVAAIVCPSLHLSTVNSLGTDMGMGVEGTLITSCGLDRRVLLWDTSRAIRAAPSAESAVEIAMSDAMARKIKSSSSDSRRGSRGEAEGDSKVDDPRLPLAIEPSMLYASGVYRGAEDAVRSSPGPLVGLCVCPSHSPVSSKQKRLLGSEQEGGSEHRGGSFVLAAASAGQFITLCVLLLVINLICCMFYITPHSDVPLNSFERLHYLP
jgi:hypothetical protein